MVGVLTLVIIDVLLCDVSPFPLNTPLLLVERVHDIFEERARYPESSRRDVELFHSERVTALPTIMEMKVFLISYRSNSFPASL